MKALQIASLLSLFILCLCSGLAEALPSREQAEQWKDECLSNNDAGLYAAALPLCQQAVDVLEKLSAAQPSLAEALTGLGSAYKGLGEYHKAEPILLRGLGILETKLGAEHRLIAKVLNRLGLLYHDQGEYSKATSLYLRSIRILEDELGPDHLEVSDCINNLADLYHAQGDYLKAEQLLVRSLRIREKMLGSDHADVAQSINNLAALYFHQGALDKVEPLLLRSLNIKEKTFGLDNPQNATALNNLAFFYKSTGSLAKAEEFYLRSMRITEKFLGRVHPDLARTLHNLGMLDLARRDPARALRRLVRVLEIREHTLGAASTEPRITALLQSLRNEEDSLYSLALFQNTPDGTIPLVLSTCLLRKGRSAEAGLMSGRALLSSLTTDVQRDNFKRWQNLRAQRETLLLRGSTDQDLATHESRLAELQDQIDIQEQRLTHALPMLAWKLPNPDEIVASVAARLPASSALIEMVLFRPYQFFARGTEPTWGQPRYLVLLLFPDQRVDFVDLGPAEQIDEAAAAFLLASRNEQRDPRRPASALYQKIFAPLIPKLRGATRLYLSLDGSLNLVPFAALYDGKRYLIDSSYQLIYLSSGRDLLRDSLAQATRPPLVLADPEFGPPNESVGQERAIDPDTRSLYKTISSLPRLVGARREGEMLKQLLGVQPLLGVSATEAAVRNAVAPVLLHIATHGILLDEPWGISGRTNVKLAGPAPPPARQQILGQSKDLSLSRSALILAGANNAAQAPNSTQDGLLTAEEARSLNLFGTQLVVLSACDTGRGSIKAGQGVYGLRRAFFVAGAETVVISLWPVSDPGTQSLMERYYRLLLDKKTPYGRVRGLSEAMKSVKVEHPHPYYWAPFIALGRDAPLVLPR